MHAAALRDAAGLTFVLAIDSTSSEPQAPAVLGQHLAVVIDVLDRMPDVVIEVRPESLIVSPPRKLRSP